MTPALLPVPIAATRDVWPKLRDRLESIRVRGGEDWLVEDVYHEVVSGNAYLFATPDTALFVIFKLYVGTSNRDLHVWIAFNASEAKASDFLDQVRVIANENSCNRITYESARKGFERAVPGTTVRYAYSIEV